jgi:hypothetical protein
LSSNFRDLFEITITRPMIRERGNLKVNSTVNLGLGAVRD